MNDIDVIKEVCKRIDKENSTHLSVVGNRKIKISNKTNNGIDIMAKRIANVENLEQRLKEGDPSLVQELGGRVGERRAVSFASKFCTVVSLAAFGNTKFAKFDSVMRDVLPIYANYYLIKKYWKKPQGAITCRRFPRTITRSIWKLSRTLSMRQNAVFPTSISTNSI